MNVIKNLIVGILVVIFPLFLFLMLWRLGAYQLGWSGSKSSAFISISAIVDWFNVNDFNGLNLFNNLYNDIAGLVSQFGDDIGNSIYTLSNTSITDLASFFQAIGNFFVVVFNFFKFMSIMVFVPFDILYNLMGFFVDIFRFIFGFLIFVAQYQQPSYI